MDWAKKYKEAQVAIRMFMKDLNISVQWMGLKNDDATKLLHNMPVQQELIDRFQAILIGLPNRYQNATNTTLSLPQQTALKNLGENAEKLFEANKHLRAGIESKKSVSVAKVEPYREEDVCKKEDYDFRFDPPLPAAKLGTDQEQTANSLWEAVEKLSDARNRYRGTIGNDDEISKQLDFVLKLRLIPSRYSTTSFTTVMETVSKKIARLVGAEVTNSKDIILVELLTEISGAILETVRAYHRLAMAYGLNSAEIEAAREKAKKRCCGEGGCSILSQIH